jgi:hypothetical protein
MTEKELDIHIWALNKIEEITAPMYDDEHYFAMFQMKEQQRIWNEYQQTLRPD